MGQQESGGAAIEAAAAKAMCLVQCAMTPRSSQRGGLTPWQAKRAIAYIDEHLGTRMGTSELAALLSYSPGHFAYAFKLSVGMSPTAFVTKRRVERAKRLMLSTGRTLSDIALDCGFADQPHLTHWFRRIVGVSPGLWRRTRVAPENGAAP